MHQEVRTTAPAPGDRDTGPRLKSVPPLAELPAPRWLTFLRGERGYAAATLTLDITAAVLAVAAAQWWSAVEDNRSIYLYAWLFVPFVVIVLASRSMYKQKLNNRFLDDFEPVETAVAVAALGTLTVMVVVVPHLQGEVIGPYVRPSDMMVRIWVWGAILLPAFRLARSLLQRYARRRFHAGAPALVIGSGSIAHQLIARMQQVPDYGLRPVGVLDDVRPTRTEVVDVPYLGTTDELEAAVRATHATELIVAPSTVSDQQLARVAHEAHDLGLRVRVVPRLMDAVGGGAWVEHLGGVPLVVLDHIDTRGWQFQVKHIGDRVAAGLGLALISPIFLALMVLVRLSSPGPIFFKQPRIGRDGKVFDCLKFRSMRPLDPDAAEFELKDGSAPGGVEGEDRRTWIGKIMRKTSLDELPQLLNVVRGEMSLVGPRPERPEFVELFEIQIRRYGERHRVKAGVTGWSQVHGLRGQTSIADRAEFDNYYIENWSLLLDVKILLLTIVAVMRSAED
ncbi:MAG: sugar transferase [Actinomycetota bacterium]|nr:sugar transferase [Actinomycetota bacterium]